MYDTTNITLFQDDYPDVNFIEEIPPLLDSVTVEGESHQGHFVNGFLGNFQVSVNPHRAKIQGASLGRFINGDNQQGMSLKSTRLAIEKMSDRLHLDVGLAKVTRIDVGRNLVTKYTPHTYMPYLGESIGYKRMEVAPGLYFKNTLRSLVLYDKVREQKEKRIPIQPVLQGQNVLRYELRIGKRLESQLGCEKVRANLLYDEGFYIKLGRMWRDQYLKISKRSNKACHVIPTSSTRELMLSLAGIAISEIGDMNVMGKISEWQQVEEITRKQASDHRKAIREAVRKAMRTEGNELIEELTKKIKEATRFFI